jgi:hypothetical protein
MDYLDTDGSWGLDVSYEANVAFNERSQYSYNSFSKGCVMFKDILLLAGMTRPRDDNLFIQRP